MSTEAFEDLYFNVCTMDYPKMARAMVPLQRRMQKANAVKSKVLARSSDSASKVSALKCAKVTEIFPMAKSSPVL
jgi:aminopeptidase